MKTASQHKGSKPNKKKKQFNKNPEDTEGLSLNKSASFNFTEPCSFDLSNKKRKLSVNNEDRTDNTSENRTENITNKNIKEKKRKSIGEINDGKELQIGLSKKGKKKRVISNADAEANEDEEAESVDSGCVDDGSTESLPDAFDLPTDWTQILSSVAAEHIFVKDILSVVPSRNKFDINEHIEDTKGSKKLEKPKVKDGDNKTEDKPTRVSNYEELTKRLEDRLHKLKKNRNTKKERIKTRRQQQKLKTKMKIICTKNKKRNKVEEPETETEGVKKKTAIQSGDGQLVFSKFDFTKPVGALKQGKKGKDLQQLLSKALKDKEKVSKLEAGGELGHARELKDKKAWKGALMRADGHKVMDDLDLLKKSVKKKQQRKKTNKDKWEKRSEKLKDKMAADEKKRKDNIRGRKQDKLKTKMKKMTKKGHIVPGF